MGIVQETEIWPYYQMVHTQTLYYWLKIKRKQKERELHKSYKKSKKAVEHESDSDTNCS